ncbi:uncharacterized protein ACLA_059090 [Aspergillus clavatus NRRL 1]|uniref:Uncharacterized protein n=1 Tax=Aspergillus clavatus (strain ATCC 1007 / CBS 513.65 / DSM 816 / NCTC 3887 / NRRL 1 / QM 1276 / 107) TaxID=344612 RepID=A1C4A6_ASPCL|nr:uncharacterized protein ACLA_059090 [Aspergillus clavatus NRRL 1]EAW15246.1 hypothetical protein ACLA_059090 [Aspergillus clavatus NRRL 1]
MRLSDFRKHIATPAHSRAIAFLLTEEPFSSASGKYSLDGLMALQVLVMESQVGPLPIIPVTESSCFVACIQEYISGLVNLPSMTRPFADTVSLLYHMRTPSSASLSEQDANVLSDLFPSLNALSQSVRTSEGRFLLGEYLGQQASEILEFWEADRVVE